MRLEKDVADDESMFEARAAIGARMDWPFLERWVNAAVAYLYHPQALDGGGR